MAAAKDKPAMVRGRLASAVSFGKADGTVLRFEASDDCEMPADIAAALGGLFEPAKPEDKAADKPAE